MYEEHLDNKTCHPRLPLPQFSLPKSARKDLKQSPVRQNQVGSHGLGHPLGTPCLDRACGPGQLMALWEEMGQDVG